MVIISNIMKREEYIHFIIPSIAILLVSFYFLPEADAYQTIEVNPVEGSRIPGCQHLENKNGTIADAGCFSPNDIIAKVGTFIIFKNTDESAHSFTSNDFNSQLMINDGSEFSWTVQPGKVEYSCVLHPWSVGTITGVVAPTINEFDSPPEWILTLFEWYADDIIEYETFINAIIYLMSYDIIYSLGETPIAEIPESEREPEPEPEPVHIPSECDRAQGKTLRKQLGCDVPVNDTRTLEEKCEEVLGNSLRKTMGCPPLWEVGS